MLPKDFPPRSTVQGYFYEWRNMRLWQSINHLLVMTAREIEAARRAMTRYVKRGGQVWIRVFPDVPITKKPLEVRMGSGKGNVEYYVARVQPGKVLFEMEGVTEEIAREAFRLAASKLSVDTLFVKRQVR